MKILAVDYGDSRTGIACCDAGEMLASPVCTIFEKRRHILPEKIAALAKEHGLCATVFRDLGGNDRVVLLN